MAIIKEWYSGKGLGRDCLWSDNLGTNFNAGSFADKPREAERLISEHVGKPIRLDRIQDIESDALGKITLFAYTTREL